MRGAQKKVLYLKNTGSPLFEEAYFILKCDTRLAKSGDISDDYVTRGMVCEANRIIEESFGKRRHIGLRPLSYALVFLFGAALTLLFTQLIF